MMLAVMIRRMRREVVSLLAAEDGAGSFSAAGAMNDAAKMLAGGQVSLRWLARG